MTQFKINFQHGKLCGYKIGNSFLLHLSFFAENVNVFMNGSQTLYAKLCHVLAKYEASSETSELD